MHVNTTARHRCARIVMQENGQDAHEKPPHPRVFTPNSKMRRKPVPMSAGEPASTDLRLESRTRGDFVILAVSHHPVDMLVDQLHLIDA